MSGALLRAPAGVDEGIDLNPPSFPAERQAAHLQAFCEKQPEARYSTGFIELYRLLRAKNTL